jgi:lysyl-tRNA synthetase class 1
VTKKTLSGRVHVGSLRGIAIHGLISQVLTEKGIKNKFLFELNDFDPMDELPKYLDHDVYKKYMGQPLYTVPSHEAGSENYPMVFGDELKKVVERLGFPAEFYSLKPLYLGGKFNEVIREALDHAAEIRAIYREVSGSQKPDDWFPFQVICENCGKVGTTQVTAWDGENVTYTCRKDLVKWAEGCGHTNSISPFDGRGKLPWKVEWPGKWKVMHVDIEGAGKDHSAAGGSRQIGHRIVEEIFHYPDPFDVPYEFFNIGGKKMSASKGLGASAKEISDLVPPNLLRMLMIRKVPYQPIDFDPEGTTIPLLFDEYDRLQEHYFKRGKEPDAEFARSFSLSQKSFPKPAPDLWQMRFSLLSFIVQMPHLNLEEEATRIKGSALTEEEKSNLLDRATYVKQWLTKYAPETARYVISDAPAALELNEKQKTGFTMFLQKLDALEDWSGEAIHKTLHEVKEASGLEPKELFGPLYKSFLNRESGPQMGWFLSTFPKEKVVAVIRGLQE